MKTTDLFEAPFWQTLSYVASIARARKNENLSAELTHRNFSFRAAVPDTTPFHAAHGREKNVGSGQAGAEAAAAFKHS
jgi:hypothetical protein